MESMRPDAALAGRVLLCSIFLMSGIGKIFNWSSTAARMTQKRMEAVPLFLAGAIAFEIIGGLCVLIGYRAQTGALLLIFFLIPATAIFHNFWMFDGPEQMNQMNHLTKNVAILGGLAVLAAHGAGRFSLDAYRRRGENTHLKIGSGCAAR